MTIPGDGDRPERLASFGEFERLWEESVESGDEWRCKNLAVASNALLGFRPDVRPVFWRVLIAQARLYQALRRTRTDGFTLPRSEEQWKALLALDGAEQFEWTNEVPDAPELSEALEVTERYLMRLLREARLLPYDGGSGGRD